MSWLSGRWSRLLYPSVFALAVLIGWAARTAIVPGSVPAGVPGDTPAVSAPAAAVSSPKPVIAEGGRVDALDVEIVPERFAETHGRGDLDLALRIRSRFAGPARVRYAWEMVTDRGARVIAPRTSPVHALDRAAAPVGETIRAAGLGDGFYELRVTAAGRDADDASSVVRSVFLRVEQGAVAVIDAGEFYGRSNANLGVRL